MSSFRFSLLFYWPNPHWAFPYWQIAMELKDQNRLEATPARDRIDGPIRFDTLPGFARQHLQKIADSVVGVVPEEQNSWTIRTGELRPDSETPEIVNKVRGWAVQGSKFIYYIQLMGNSDLDAIRKAYSDSRDRDRGKRAYARLMKNQSSVQPIAEKLPTCFYVGSSSNISLRLKEHLGYGAKVTFSLQLAHWTMGLDLELKFICAKYGGLVTPDVYQALEDTLWDQLQPVFGRKGRR